MALLRRSFPSPRLWHAAVREGHVLRREAIHEQGRQQVASVEEFLNATRARLVSWDGETPDQN
jgi:hypothetical protein